MSERTIEKPTAWTSQWFGWLTVQGAVGLVLCYLIYLGVKLLGGGGDALLEPDVAQSTFTYWTAVPAALAVIGLVMVAAHYLGRRDA